MAEEQEGYLDQLKNLWAKLNTRAKIIIISAIILLIITFFILIFWGTQATYNPLFTNLNSQDAAAIVNRLKEQNISYRLTDDGSTIMVPANNVHEIRLEMAGEGLPTQGVVGFEIFNNSQFGTTDFERKVNYYRAVGGELSRSIKTMNGVAYARVQITAPKESLFVEEERSASASVLLKLDTGFQIKSDHVNSIANLVASSVQGLPRENVTIVDTAGNLLSSLAGRDTNNQVSMEQSEMRNSFENGLRSDLHTMLTKVLGPDNFAIQVRAKLNFDQKEVESKTYTPVVDDEGIVRSEEIEEEVYEGDSSAAMGVPGTESNIPQYEQEAGNGQNTSNYEKTNTITNYEINEKLERYVYSVGDLERLSVSIILDNSVSNDTVRKIENSVKAAIGYDQTRGDQINVSSMAFDDSLEQEMSEAEASAQAASRRKMYIYAALIALTLIIITVIIVILRRSTATEYMPGEKLDYTVGQELEGRSVEEEEDKLTEEQKKRKKMRKELEDVVTQQPEDIAQLLKNWLIEE